MGLGQQLEAHTIDKTYHALVMGKLEGSGEVKLPIGGREAHTVWKCLQCKKSNSFDWGWVTLVEAKPVTGRTHQIRIHLQQLGHSIVGDDLYPLPQYTVLRRAGLFLTCVAVQFDNPITKENQIVQVEPPYKFGKFMERQGGRSDQENLTGAVAEGEVLDGFTDDIVDLESG